MRDTRFSSGRVHMHFTLDAVPEGSPRPSEPNVGVGDVEIEDVLWARRRQAIIQCTEAMKFSAELLLASDRCQDPEKKLAYQRAATVEKNKASQLWMAVKSYNVQIEVVFKADDNFDPKHTIDEIVDEAREKSRIREPEDGPATVSSPASTRPATEQAGFHGPSKKEATEAA